MLLKKQRKTRRIILLCVYFQTGLHSEIERAGHLLCTASVNSFKFIKRISTEFDLPFWIQEFTSLWQDREKNSFPVTYINTGNSSFYFISLNPPSTKKLTTFSFSSRQSLHDTGCEPASDSKYRNHV